MARKYLLCGLLVAWMMSMQVDLIAQSKKKSAIADRIGALAGMNQGLFYPKEINGNPIKGGNPTLIPDMMYGLSYHHQFNTRWSHIFQFRIADHQMKFWKSYKRYWHVNGEKIIVESDTGQYHINYTDVSMNYMLGWTLHKNTRWNVFAGVQISYTVDNKSTKTVDRFQGGTFKGFQYVPHPQPLYFYNETLRTYSTDTEAFALLRTDCGIALAKQWMLRPVLEYGLNLGGVHHHSNQYVSFYLEIYKAI